MAKKFFWKEYQYLVTLQHKSLTKKIEFMRKILFMLLMLFSMNGFAESTLVDESTVIDVVLEKGDSKDHSSERPRTLIPIVCVYVDGMVQLTLLGEVGEYTLTVTNQMTGERWSATNALILQTSTASGIYWVEIVTEDGTTYYGSYTL